MKTARSTLAIICCALLLLGGCAKGTRQQAGDAATVEDRAGADADAAGAQRHGVAGSERFSGAALDDPNSPLSVRVIYFDYDSTEIRADYQEAVQAHAQYLAANQNTVVTLEGHADERGSREYNLALGERRANAVRRQLVLLGASAGQIRTVSYGEERPVNEGHDESSWALNRRVELVY
ncbi:MAG: peptidoglycan-associated lipoprotein Pal [Gammaproteobacteria bacterium]|nr:peptidoglycan-associated lipoprotein Pal [Gammaproteobacteria bacterium]